MAVDKDFSVKNGLQVGTTISGGNTSVTGFINVSSTANIGGALSACSTLTVAANVNVDSGTLFVDATNNRIGIGTITPDAPLQVVGAANVSGDLRVGGNFIITGTTTTAGTQEVTGNIIPVNNTYNLGNTTARWTVYGNAASFSNNVTISGNLVVSGSRTIINSIAEVSDSKITISANAATAINASFIVNRGSTGGNASIRWNETSTKWEITGDGSTYNTIGTSNTTGTVTSVTVTGNTVSGLSGTGTVTGSGIIIIGAQAANTTANGAVQLLDSVTNTSIATYAPTANAVKTAYDAGIAANTRAASAQTAAAAAYSNAITYSSNATNLTSGTIDTARLTAATIALVGVSQLNDTVTSISIVQAATANAAKTAYDAGIAANTRAASAQTAATAAFTNAVSQSFANATNGLAINGTAANATLFASQSLATVQGWITANAATAFTNAVANAVANTSQAYANATNGLAINGTAANATLFASQSLATVQGWITGNSATAFTNAVSNAVANVSQAYANATNGLPINGSANNAAYLGGIAAAFYVQNTDSRTLSGNLTFTANASFSGANVTITSTNTYISGNVNVLASIQVGTPATAAANGILANTTVISVGNNSINTTINATSFSGTAANATLFASQTLTTVQGWITANAATAFTNATSYADTKAATAFTNAVSNAVANVSQQYANATNGFAINGTAANATLFASQSLATIQGQISGNAATAYSNATTFAANATNITSGTLANARLPSAISVTSLSGNGAGLTSVNYNSQSNYAVDTAIFVSGDSGVWQNSSPKFYPTLPTGISTLYASFQVDLFIKQVADAVASSGDLGYGGGNPEFAYRLVKGTAAGANTVLFTSEWSTLSTAGSGTAFLTTVKDATPIAGNTIGYALQYQWRSVSSNPNANAGTISTSNGTTLAITGTGTYWQGTVNPRLEIASANATTNTSAYVKIDAVLGKGSLTTTTAIGSKTAVTYRVRDQYANVVMNQSNILVTFNGFC